MSLRDVNASTTCHSTLRFSGNNLDVAAVSGALELEPSRSQEGGNGKGGLWELTSRGQIDSANIEAHIHWIIDKVEPNSNRFTRLGNSRGTEVVMDCVWHTDESHGGPLVSAKTLARLGDLRIDLVIDVHPAGT